MIARADADSVGNVRAYLEQGAPWDACDEFRQAVAASSADNADLLYWGALAFARVGSTQRAFKLLDQAQASAAGGSVPLDEILSLRGRIWKDRFQRAATIAERVDFAGKAREQYLAGYALRRDNTYPGINAATSVSRTNVRAKAKLATNASGDNSNVSSCGLIGERGP